MNSLTADHVYTTCQGRDFIIVHASEDLLSSKANSIFVLNSPSIIQHHPLRSISGINLDEWMSRHIKCRTSYKGNFSFSEGRSIALIDEAVYDAEEGFVICLSQNNLILHTSHHTAWQAEDYLRDRYGNIQHYIQMVLNGVGDKNPVSGANPICIINTKWSTRNYYHWVQESLPRLDYTFELFGNRIDYIWAGQQQPLPYHIDSINYIGVERISKFAGPRFLRLKRLIWPSYHQPGTASSYDFKWKENINISIPHWKKIFIDRRPKVPRSFANLPEIYEVALTYGYHKIYLEDLTFKEQVALFRQATHIFGAHGAGLVNTMFSSSLKVCEVMPGTAVNPCFAAICTSVIGTRPIANEYSVVFSQCATGYGQFLQPDKDEIAIYLE